MTLFCPAHFRFVCKWGQKFKIWGRISPERRGLHGKFFHGTIPLHSFCGHGTFSRSPTSGAARRTVHDPCFRGRPADKNAFWMVSISTSGLELWRFEFLCTKTHQGLCPACKSTTEVWGHKTRATIYSHISFLRQTEANRGYSKARRKNQKYLPGL